MSKIYYAIAWYYDISLEEAIKEYEEMSNEMADVIWYCYDQYTHNRDVLSDGYDDDDEDDYEQLFDIVPEYYVEEQDNGQL